ncbi:hypothetical protein [Clostridium sp.]|uniref:hypothetical protein n=1 Tax=Clostridium sp. TaxID=1506 RepID=UPI001B4A3A0D|nr:hypothetical protein [Clostridium sp.]MBP3916968.1 hypothetical protein [Clostridium sp.]
MGEFFSMIMEFIKDINNQINEKGFEGILPAILIIIAILVYISPSYIIVFLYNKHSYVSLESIISILIMDTILFITLFIVGLSRGIINKKNMKVEYDSKLLNEIQMTLVFMSIISAILLFIYLVIRFISGDYLIRIGLGVVVCSVVVISIPYLYKWYKIFQRYRNAKEENKRLNAELEDMPNINEDEKSTN